MPASGPIEFWVAVQALKYWFRLQGFAYVEFLEADAVTAACLLEGSELHSRALKVEPSYHLFLIGILKLTLLRRRKSPSLEGLLWRKVE